MRDNPKGPVVVGLGLERRRQRRIEDRSPAQIGDFRYKVVMMWSQIYSA